MKIFSRIVILLISLIASSVAVSSTIYTFTQTSSSAGGIFTPGSAFGTINFASPPSSSSAPWETNDPANVIQIDVNISTTQLGSPINIRSSDFTDPYVLIVNNVASNDGTQLDSGVMFYDIPILVDDPLMRLTFSNLAGQDEIIYAANLGAITVTGDWQVVPIPATAWLFCSGLIGLIGFARRKKS